MGSTENGISGDPARAVRGRPGGRGSRRRERPGSSSTGVIDVRGEVTGDLREGRAEGWLAPTRDPPLATARHSRSRTSLLRIASGGRLRESPLGSAAGGPHDGGRGWHRPMAPAEASGDLSRSPRTLAPAPASHEGKAVESCFEAVRRGPPRSGKPLWAPGNRSGPWGRSVRVGARGFEPPTSASRRQRSTKLSHAPRTRREA